MILNESGHGSFVSYSTQYCGLSIPTGLDTLGDLSTEVLSNISNKCQDRHQGHVPMSILMQYAAPQGNFSLKVVPAQNKGIGAESKSSVNRFGYTADLKLSI